MTDLDSSEWQAYTEYGDRMILAGFTSAVRCSLQYLMDNTDAAQRITPLFEVQLVLNSNEMTFDPSLDLSHTGNFYDIVDKMVGNITSMASLIPRVASHKQLSNYQVPHRLDYKCIYIYVHIFPCKQTLIISNLDFPSCSVTLMKWRICQTCAT